MLCKALDGQVTAFIYVSLWSDLRLPSSKNTSETIESSRGLDHRNPGSWRLKSRRLALWRLDSERIERQLGAEGEAVGTEQVA